MKRRSRLAITQRRRVHVETGAANMRRAAERLRKGAHALAKGRHTKDAAWKGPSVADMVLGRGTWAAMAEALGVTAATVSRWVCGAREPSFAAGLRMAEYLKVDPWVLDAWLHKRREWRRSRIRELKAPK